MNKRELIQFLEPFDDEIKLVVRNEIGPMRSILGSNYECRKSPFRTPEGELIEQGEGLIILETR